tara:strand:- start:162 stop:689 length:528 start_codon:yes stop_codon:yes gene_type:complete
MKNLYKILILSFISVAFCCEIEEITREMGDYQNGKKHGKWNSYCKHDQKIIEGYYKHGKKHGQWIFYFEDGRVWYKGNYKNGKEHGEFIYFGNGNYNILHKLELNNYKNGNLDGETIYYHINGEKNSIIHYKDGKKHGKNTFYDKDGRIYWSGTYKNGDLISGGPIETDRPFNLY